MIVESGLPVFLDACVLYPAPLRDFLLHLAAEGLYRPKWTDRVHEEWTRNLLINRPDLTIAQLDKTVAAMNRSFPDALVVLDETLLSSIQLPDPDDRHVVAGALSGTASIILTVNLRDFPRSQLGRYDLEALHPDVFTRDLIELNPDEVTQAFYNQVANLRNPPMSPEAVLQTLLRNGLQQTVERLSALL
jgi:hypothetical protein